MNNPNKRGPLGTQVNTLSGNLFIPRTDIYIPARGFDLNISFSYNSFLFTEDLGYGKGWTFKYNIRYSHDTSTTGSRLILWGDGREDKYDSLPGGGYKSPKGFFNTLSQYQPGKYVITELDGVKYFFDNAVHKRITKMEEPNGNYINFNYTDSLLTSMTNTAGQTISFTYNPQGRLATVVDPVAVPARTYTYSYDAVGNLKEVKDPLNGKCQYTYLVNGPMKSIADKNNNKVDIIYFPDLTIRELIGCNKRLSFSYDTTIQTTFVTDHLEAGNQVTKYSYKTVGDFSWITSMSGNCCGFNISYEYDDNGNQTKMTDANGQVYLYTYDAFGNVLTVTDPLLNVSTYTYTTDFKKINSYKDPKGNLYTLSYDANGNLTQLVTPGNNLYTAIYNSSGDIITSTDPKGNVYAYNYDSWGNPSSVTGPNGFSAALAFDARGNLLSFTDARGNNSTAEYDILNRLKKITDPINNFSQLNYDANGNIISITNKNAETSLLSYDASNRLVKATGPTGNQTTFSYDGMNNLLSTKNALGHETKMSYDNRNRLKSAKDPESNNAIYNYDGNGNITSVSFPNGRTLNYSYDNANRLISVQDATSTITTLAYDKNGNITSMTNATGAITTATYDSLNRLKNLTDPLGNSTQFSYDKNNNIVSVTDRENHTSFYTYDSLDRVKTFTDNNGFVITVGYDAQSNITSLKDQNNNTTTYTYDSLNRRKRMTYADGKYVENSYDKEGNIIAIRLTDATTITYQYDTLNRVINRTMPGGEVYSFTYDKLNRVLTATNNNGTVTFTYDALNRVSSENFDGRTTRYNYNISGRTQTIIYPDSSIILKEYDTRNRLIKISKDGTTIAEYAYNNADQLTNKNFANGVSSVMQYDFANRLSSISTLNGTIQNTTFSYDKEYNKTAINRLNAPSLSEQFTYDNGYRLTNYKRGPVGSPVIQNTYNYDAVGNRTSANLNGVATTYTINNLNQLTSVNGTNFTFDNRGNLTYDGTFYKTYDAENRLIKDSSSPASVIGYGYDAIGRRITKTINGNLLKYTYSGAVQIEERTSGNDLLNRTIYNGFLSPVMNEKNGNKFYYHPNELGSVEAITNNNGRLIESYRYDVYGKLSRYDSINNPLLSSLAGNRFGFTGQEYDSASGSYRFFFRNYSPETGVFNQRDLLEYGDGMGMYQYVGNNPANGVDVWGLEECDDKDPTRSIIPIFPWDDVALDFWNEEYYRSPGDLGKALYGGATLNTFFTEVAGTGTFKGLLSGTWTKVSGPARIYEVVKNGSRIPPTLIPGSSSFIPMLKSSRLMPLARKAVTIGKTAAMIEGQLVIIVLQKDVEMWVELQDLEAQREARATEIETIKHLWDQDQYSDEEKIRRIKVLGSLERAMKERDEINQSMNPCDEGGTRKRARVVYNPVTGEFEVLQGWDPNLITGPEGLPDKKWVSVNDRMPYTIQFENDTSATARVRYIKITSPIEPKQDASTLELGSVGFNNQTFEIPTGLSSYYQRLDARDSTGVYVDLTAGYDVINNQIFWEFQAIDPITLLPPEDPLVGFLFLPDSTQPEYGHGFVNFSIKPISSANTLDTIGARAFIVFDENEVIPTNIHTNTIDAVAPVSSIAPLPYTTPDTEVIIHYTGSDDPNGSGVKEYSVYVSDNNGSPQLYFSGITATDTVFHGVANHTYKFYIKAIDTAGNEEILRLVDSITVTDGQNIICPNSNVSFDSKMSGTTYQWQVDNGTGYTNVVNGGIHSGATTSILNLTNAPSSMYGYKFRCLVNGTTYSLEFLLKFGMTWEGTVSTAWEDPANWSCNMLPDMNTDVVVNGEKLNFPQVNSNVTIRTLRMNPGSTANVNAGFTLTILK